MAALMNVDSGVGPFMDNYIVILAGRYGAPITCGPFQEAHAASWENVATSVQVALNHPVTDSERQQLSLVDPRMFTARVCHHRASYLLWKARREAAAGGPAVSPFNITKHSIADDIALIYQNAKDRLPSISMDDDDDDDASDGGAADAVVEPHAFPHKTIEEVARDRRIAEAEDELMRKVQELQVEFFDRHRKWVDVPMGSTPTVSPKKTTAASLASNSSKSNCQLETNFCIGNINRKPLVDVTPEEVAVVFDALDISEHKVTFRRTTGRVLNTIKRSELADRFAGNAEAADLLWAWIEERRMSAPSSKSNTPTKRGDVKPGTAHDAARQQVTSMLDMFRRMGNGSNGPEAMSKTSSASTTHYLDPLAQMKRAMNPHRPPRPSQQDDDYEEALAAMEDDGSDPTAKPLSKSQPRPTSTTIPSRDPRSSAAAPTQAAQQNMATPPARSNRWQVVEYEDDDDDE